MEYPVDALFTLQEKINTLKTRRVDRERMPPDVAELNDEFRIKEAAVEELSTQLETVTEERESVEQQLAEAAEELKSTQARLMEVRTNKEYSAALNEIDSSKKRVKTLEERSIDLGASLENDREQLAALEEGLPAQREDFEEKISHWREFQRECDEEIEALTKSVDTIEAELPKPLKSQFDRLIGRRTEAVMRVSGGFCPSCKMSLRPALHQQIRLNSRREVIACETCQCILYYSE